MPRRRRRVEQAPAVSAALSAALHGAAERSAAEQAEADARRERVKALAAAAAADSTAVFVRNVPYAATEAQLSALFERFGTVASVDVVSRRTPRGRAVSAVVSFASRLALLSCLNETHTAEGGQLPFQARCTGGGMARLRMADTRFRVPSLVTPGTHYVHR